ncbi:MAG: citrate/2-methylcitrate synthase, partial [Oscillospiraceae bacterium]
TNIMVKAYQVRRRYYENKTMFLHPLKYGLSVAEEILSLLRVDREYTKDEALLLDMCLILHAEHGGGNNSTFACRVLSSSGTDAYSAYAAAIGSLKGPKHGGANIKVLEMLMNIEENVADIRDKGQVTDYLKKIIKKEANDKTGLIYGMGHAVYTVSDPRAIVLRDKIETMIGGTEFEDEFNLLKTIEEVTPKIFIDEKGNPKPICANVDLYSGLVYKMLKIPMELFTPIFATSRIAGWGAHRIEELTTGNRIIRPAYKPVVKSKIYVGIDKR